MMSQDEDMHIYTIYIYIYNIHIYNIYIYIYIQYIYIYIFRYSDIFRLETSWGHIFATSATSDKNEAKCGKPTGIHSDSS